MSGKVIFKNAIQDLRLMEFMIANPDFTRGKENRVVTAQKWEELLGILNAAGPPVKNMIAWKKIKVNRIAGIRSKLAKSPSGDSLFPLEKKVATICGFLDPPEGVVRSTRIKRQPDLLVLNEPQVKKKSLARKTLVKKLIVKKPIVKNESMSEDEGEWEDVESKPLSNQQSGYMPKILQTLQTMTGQLAEHFGNIEEIERKKLKVTKAISENIAKMVRN